MDAGDEVIATVKVSKVKLDFIKIKACVICSSNRSLVSLLHLTAALLAVSTGWPNYGPLVKLKKN